MNYHLFDLVNRWAGRADALDDVMEFAATWLIYVSFAVATAVVGWALYRRRVTPVGEFGAALVLAFATATALSHVSHQLRPFQSHRVHQLIAHDGGVSLPSDHATAAFALAFGVGAFLSRRWGLALAALALAIGVARVWVGVHYPGDIAVAAMIAGLAVLEVSVWSLARRGSRSDSFTETGVI